MPSPIDDDSINKELADDEIERMGPTKRGPPRTSVYVDADNNDGDNQIAGDAASSEGK